MIKKTTLVAIVLLALPVLAHGNITFVGIPPALTGSFPPPGIGGQNDIAYNDKQRVYLQVWGHPAVWGRFVNENGVALFDAPFLIASTGTSDGLPRVTYSTGGADDVFMVRMASEAGLGRYLFTRLVRYTPNGPELGPLQHVAGVGNEGIYSGGVAFNPVKRQFYLTWESTNGGWDVYGQLWQMLGTPGASLSPTVASIGPATPVHNVSQMGNAQGCPNVAYDWKHDSYFVVWCGETVVSDRIFGAWGRQVRFDANNLVSFGNLVELTSGNGRPLEPGVTYMPEADGFLTFWTDVTLVRDLSGRRLDHNGGIQSGIFPILATSSNEGAADAEYSPYTRSIFVAAMRDATKYVQGIRLSAAGVPIDDFQASSAIPIGANESFYPNIGVGHDGRFGLSYVNSFANVYVEILAGPVVAGGHFVPGWASSGTPPPPPPPPPPPDCSISFSATSATLGPLGGTGSVRLTTGSSCTWAVGSSASWVTLGSGSTNGTGTSTISYSVAPNASADPRSAIIYSGNRSLTIVQTGRSLRQSDLNRDGFQDLIWQNSMTGELAVWHMRGIELVGSQSLNPGNIGDTNWKIVGTFDANLDGYADLLFQHDDGYVMFWRMAGATHAETIVLSLNVAGDRRWRIVGTGDMDRDGFGDIVWQHLNGQVAVWYLFGDGFQIRDTAIIANVSDSRWRVAGVSDFNHDGRLDILWRHADWGQLLVWHMNDRQFLSSGMNLVMNNRSWQVVAVHDFSGDGRPDLIWHNALTGELAAWFLDSGAVIGSWALRPGAVPNLSWRVAGPR